MAGSANAEKFSGGVNWITDVSAFGFSLAAGLTTGIGRAVTSLSFFDTWQDSSKVFVFLVVAAVIAWLWYLAWLYGAADDPDARAKRLARVYACVNMLLLWGVAAGFDLKVS